MPMSSNPSSNAAPLSEMRAALERHLAGDLPADGLVRAWREQTAALALPPAYGPVLQELLRRLEMSSAFAQDSCSFSSTAITDQMRIWLDKAASL